MNPVVAIGAGGAIGSILRYALSCGAARWLGTAFPYGTVIVNVAGSFTIGLLYVWLVERMGTSDELRGFLIVGVLGGFTTFSSFSLETTLLLMQSSYLRAALNIFLSVSICVGATALGIMLARQV